MPDCIEKDRTRRVRLFPLDVCGRIQTTGAASVLDFDGFETIGFSEQVTAGDRELITTTSGRTCRDKTSCPTDQGQNVTLNECEESWALMAIAGYGTLELSTATTHPGLPVGTVVGFNRNKVACDAKFALEILFELDAACDAQGNPVCIARLYPMLDKTVLSGDKLVNGKAVIRGSYTATTERNARLFENFPLVPGVPGPPVVPDTHPPTGELAYWAPWEDDVASGQYFYLDRLVDCPAIADDQVCELRALVV